MGCTNTKPSQPQSGNNNNKPLESSTTRKPLGSNNKQISNQSNRTGGPQIPPIEDLDSLNSKKAKIMTFANGEKDYNPREQNYLREVDEVKMPIDSESGSGSGSGSTEVSEWLSNEKTRIQTSKATGGHGGELNNKYRVPKITYPKLGLEGLVEKSD